MKLLIVFCIVFIVAGTVYSQCSSRQWQSCIIGALEKHICNTTSWCSTCTPVYEDYLNCTCTNDLSQEAPECVDLCIEMELCDSQQSFNSSLSCNNQTNDFNNCLPSKILNFHN